MKTLRTLLVLLGASALGACGLVVGIDDHYLAPGDGGRAPTAEAGVGFDARASDGGGFDAGTSDRVDASSPLVVDAGSCDASSYSGNVTDPNMTCGTSTCQLGANFCCFAPGPQCKNVCPGNTSYKYRCLGTAACSGGAICCAETRSSAGSEPQIESDCGVACGAQLCRGDVECPANQRCVPTELPGGVPAGICKACP